MAKLNITFVNEVGTNLNRYKAIDVNTGEEYLFDLSRNGTITTPGTPLNAEIMNAIVQAINEHFSNLVGTINDTTPSDTKYPSEKAVVDYVGQIANEESVDVSDNVLIKISGVSDNLAIPPESQMEVNSIEGNSVVVNQLSQIANNAEQLSNGVTWKITDHIMTATGTATANFYNSWEEIPLIAGHKYFINGPRTMLYMTGQDLYHAGDCGIVTCSVSGNYDYQWNIISGTTVNYKFRLLVIDLTQWFGSNDNIPQDILNTPSNFFKYYKGSLAYDTGHIENGSGNLVDTNRNIWDEEYVATGYILDDGTVSLYHGERFASKNFIRIFPNTEYYFKVPYLIMDYGVRVAWYDSNKNFISVSDYYPTNNVITSPSNASFMKFNVHYIYGSSTYKNDICINVSDTNFNGTYVAHIKNTLDFGNDTLRSAGKARDKKIPDGEITRKVGRVDLGTLNWDYNSDYNIAEAVISDMKQPASYDDRQKGIICSKYSISSTVSLDNNMDDKSILRNVGKIYIRDTSYTDAATFKAAMSGVYLYYELATPTTEQGTPYDNYIPVYYGGQEFTTGNVPFVINKNYDISIKDQVLTNVKVDKEQSKQIHALENVNREQSNAIDSLQNKVSNLETTQDAHSTSISSLTTKVTDLESYKFDSSKLTIEQNLVNTILKYNNVEINRIENLDVAYLPNIVFDVYQDSQFTAQEKVTITNSTDMDMYVSIKGLKEHNNLFVPFGESITSQLEISDFSGFPDSYIATIEIKIYYNPKTNYNATTGYTVFENVKTINLRATVHPTDR